MKILLTKLTEEFAQELKHGQRVTYHDLQQYCKNRHKNIGTSPLACSRMMKLCPLLEQVKDKNGKIRHYERR